MASILKKLLSGLLLAALVGVVAYAMVKPDQDARERPSARRGAGGERGAGAAIPVLAARAELKDVPVLLDAVGTVRPLNTVTVRPQVEGRILKIHFQEGQDVKAGDLIAELDPATHQALLDQANAKRAITAAQLANARRDYERMAKIPNVVAQKAMDTQEAQVDQLEAQLKSDDAAIASARTMLGYTRIASPISGRAGLRLVDEGNLVRSGDAGIVTITEIDPIAVLFALPQQRLLDVQRAAEKGPVAVEALDSDGRAVIEAGTLEVIDNQIDQQTGTIRMKAQFPNPRRRLWPGQFVNVRVKVDTLDDVIAVPTVAVQRGPAGTFVWLVGPEGGAIVRPIETGLTTETLAVVPKGLEAGEQVVTSGFARVSEGAKLEVRDAPVSAPVSFVPPPRGRRGTRGANEPGKAEKGKRSRERQGAEVRSSEAGPKTATLVPNPATSQAERPRGNPAP